MNKTIIKLILFGTVLSFVILMYGGYIKTELGAILVALTLGILGIFQDWIRSNFFYPELKIELNLSPPDCHKTFWTQKYKRKYLIPKVATSDFAGEKEQWSTYTVECYYYRLRIVNKGNYRARRVEVIAKEKYSQNKEGKFEKDKNFLPLNFRWSHDKVIIRESIAPSLSRYCDFGFIIPPESTYIAFLDGGVYEKGVVLNLDLEIKPNTKSHLVFPGKHRIKIIAVTDNSELVSKIFEIELNDFWDNDEAIMLEKGLRIKEVESLE